MPVLLTLAVVAGALLQPPPPVPSVNVVAAPVHTVVIPPIAAGDTNTVTVLVTVQPVPRE